MIGKIFSSKDGPPEPGLTAPHGEALASSTHMNARAFGEVLDIRVSCDSLSQRVADILTREIGDLLDRGHTRVIIDFGECALLPSAGIGLLLVIRDRLRRAGGSLAIYGVSPEIRGVMKITRLDKHFEIREGRTDALAAVS